jgi:hypothetical protein
LGDDNQPLNHSIAQSPNDHQITRSPNHQITTSPD